MDLSEQDIFGKHGYRREIALDDHQVQRLGSELFCAVTELESAIRPDQQELSLEKTMLNQEAELSAHITLDQIALSGVVSVINSQRVQSGLAKHVLFAKQPNEPLWLRQSETINFKNESGQYIANDTLVHHIQTESPDIFGKDKEILELIDDPVLYDLLAHAIPGNRSKNRTATMSWQANETIPYIPIMGDAEPVQTLTLKKTIQNGALEHKFQIVTSPLPAADGRPIRKGYEITYSNIMNQRHKLAASAFYLCEYGNDGDYSLLAPLYTAAPLHPDDFADSISGAMDRFMEQTYTVDRLVA